MKNIGNKILSPASSRGLPAGSSEIKKLLDPAVKPRDDSFDRVRGG